MEIAKQAILRQLLYTELGSLYILARMYTTGVEFVIISRVVGLDPSWRSTVREIPSKWTNFQVDDQIFLLIRNSKTSHGHSNLLGLSCKAF